jgi:hypothetical protein
VRRNVVLLLCLLAAGCGGDDGDDERAAAPPSRAGTALVVRVDEDGASGPEPQREAEVRCSATDSSPPCAAAADLKPADFAPVPGDVACTQQYGGPETARVTGTLRGEPIDARFSREQGCEIARWDSVVAVLDRNPIP